MPNGQPILLVVDAFALIYRSFYAFPETITDKDAHVMNAAYGFMRILLDSLRKFSPQYIAVAFDSPTQTTRQQLFPYYKSTRPPMPDILRAQLQPIKDFVTALNIPQFYLNGEEADDIIGTLVCQTCQQHPDVLSIILTGDRDTLQLVNDHVHVYLPKGKKPAQEMDAAAVEVALGVSPDQVIDYKALAGDPSDDIKGIPGVGPKTAVTLLKEFSSLDNLYHALAAHATPSLSPKLAAKLLEFKQLAYDSKFLATIKCDISLFNYCLDDCLVANFDKLSASEFLENLGFTSLLKILPADKIEQDLQEALF